MAKEDRRTGNASVVYFTPSGGVRTEISGDQTEFSLDRQQDTADATAGNETTRYQKPTIEALDFSMTIFDAGQAYKGDLLPGTEGLLEIMPEGEGAGLEIISFNILLTGYNASYPFDDMIEIEVSGVRQGDMINDVGSTQSA